MSRYAGLIRRCIFLIPAVLLMGHGMIRMHNGRTMNHNIQMVTTADYSLSGTEIREIRKAELKKEYPADVTVWRELKNEPVSNAGGFHSTVTDVILINGSSELLVPYGRMLHEEDREGCLIGEKTAERLFGNRNAKGLALRYKDRELTVRGILKEPADLLVLEAGEEETFNRITVLRQEGQPVKAQGEQLIHTYGISAVLLRRDFISWEWLSEMIPGKWSDFAGWRDSFERKREELHLLFSVEKTVMDEVFLAAAGKGAAEILSGCVLLILCFTAGKKQRGLKAPLKT